MDKIALGPKHRVAFVASGGAVKAACFHIGVCLALEEKGFHFIGGVKGKNSKNHREVSNPVSIYVGSSAGSMIAALLSCGYSVYDVVNSFAKKPPYPKKSTRSLPRIRYLDLFHVEAPDIVGSVTDFFKKKKLASGGIEAFIKNHLTFGGIFTTDGLEKYLRLKALPTNKFEDLEADLFIVATQLDHSLKTVFSRSPHPRASSEHHCVYDSKISISQAAAASMALPPMYKPYPITSGERTKTYFYDGEIRETLSTHVAKEAGADLIIASYTHQPYHYHEEVGSLAQYGISTVMIQAIYQMVEQKIQTAKKIRDNKKMTLETINQFFKENDLPDRKRGELCQILEEKLEYSPNLDYIFIHPHPHDYELFFEDHFNLSGQVMEKIVRAGFRSALHILKDYKLSP